MQVLDEKPPKKIKRGKDIKFAERTLFHKVARVVYRINRGFYVAFMFYFIPFYILVFDFYLAVLKQSGKKES